MSTIGAQFSLERRQVLFLAQILLSCLLLAVAYAPTVHAALPDTRGYEQATPVDKGGAAPQGQWRQQQSAPDGDGITFISASPFPNSAGAQEFGNFLSARSSQAWSTQGLLPPASVGRSGKVLSISEDLKFSYVSSSLEPYVETLFQRVNSSGALTKIVTSEPFRRAPEHVQTSADGSKVLLESEEALTPNASGVRDLYLWDRTSGTISLVSVLNEGEAPASGSFAGPYSWRDNDLGTGGKINGSFASPQAFTADGSAVYFTAAQTGKLYARINLEAPQSPLDASQKCSVFTDACTYWASRPRTAVVDPNGEKPAIFYAASEEGKRTILFGSSGRLTENATTGPTDQGRDLYRYFVDEDRLEDLAPAPQEPNGANVQGVLGVSNDGTIAYFSANGVIGDGLSKGALPGDCEGPGHSAECRTNLYVWSEAQGIKFIAPLSVGGSFRSPNNDGNNWLPSVSDGPDQPSARVSASGNALLFRSSLQLDSSFQTGGPQFYRYQLSSGSLICVTCNRAGSLAAFVPTLSSLQSFVTGSNNSVALNRNISANGNRIFFETGEALVPEDTNGLGGCPLASSYELPVPRCLDVYEWEAAGEGSCPSISGRNGCQFLISTGNSNSPSSLSDADRDGSDVFFLTTQSLVGQDKDQIADVYDARIGGGIPGQNGPLPTSCTSSAFCGGASSGPPTPPIPASSSFKAKVRHHCKGHHQKSKTNSGHRRTRSKSCKKPQRKHRHVENRRGGMK